MSCTYFDRGNFEINVSAHWKTTQQDTVNQNWSNLYRQPSLGLSVSAGLKWPAVQLHVLILPEEFMFCILAPYKTNYWFMFKRSPVKAS